MEQQNSEAAYSGKQLQILEVAERLFAERGFDGTSVRDIASEAAVNVAMISYYFGSKEKLLHAVFHNRISASRLVLEHLLNDKDMHPLAKIEAMVDAMVDRMMQNRNFQRVMLRSQLSPENSPVSALILDTKMKNLELVGKIIAEGQRKKVFTKEVDVAMLMMSVVGTMYQATTGSAYFKLARPDGISGEDAALEILKAGLKKHLKRLLKGILTYEGK